MVPVPVIIIQNKYVIRQWVKSDVPVREAPLSACQTQ